MRKGDHRIISVLKIFNVLYYRGQEIKRYIGRVKVYSSNVSIKLMRDKCADDSVLEATSLTAVTEAMA